VNRLPVERQVHTPKEHLPGFVGWQLLLLVSGNLDCAADTTDGIQEAFEPLLDQLDIGEGDPFTAPPSQPR
jgi:hypothetical protein